MSTEGQQQKRRSRRYTSPHFWLFLSPCDRQLHIVLEIAFSLARLAGDHAVSVTPGAPVGPYTAAATAGVSHPLARSATYAATVLWGTPNRGTT